MSLKTKQSCHWFVACPQFMESLLADELDQLGAELVRIRRSGVAMSGDLELGYRVILWSRLASRLTLQLADNQDHSAEGLGELLQSVTWSDHLPPNGTLRVRFLGRNDTFRNTQFGAQWAKDQIVDWFQERFGQRPSVAKDPDLTIVVTLQKKGATIGLELNGQSLHHRGYRPAGAKAPLRENLAAAVLIRSGWPDRLQGLLPQATPEAPLTLADPLCGSGTLLIEGALMAFDWAPGLLREESLAVGWLGHDQALWQQLTDQARDRQAIAVAQADRVAFWGNDRSDSVFREARATWRRIGLPEARWTQSDIGSMPAVSEASHGLVVTNPPYGERLSTPQALAALYSALGDWLKRLPEQWQAGMILPEAASVADTGLFYDREYRLLNGDIECRVYTFPQLTERQEKTHPVVPDLANRLRKNLRKLKPFIKSGVTDAYRIYDADLPEYAVAVDRYADWLHVQEYAAPSTIPEPTARRRLGEAVSTLADTLDVPRSNIVVKQRQRQKGRQQYERQAEAGEALVVHEHGVRLQVNLTDYLDTGLFLDHRPMRHWLQQQSAGARVLNLFCYTGTASVHAAKGGAKRVDSVDMSATYLNWARDNFRLNHLTINQHGFFQADVLAWLQDCTETYDLIFLDPPTFSNSKRMEQHFDVQHDHVWLLKETMKRLRLEGTLIFSNNYRRFVLDEEIRRHYSVEDVRRQSLPADFQRRERIHACWFIRHKPL